MAWVFFRAGSVTSALRILAKLCTPSGWLWQQMDPLVPGVAAVLLVFLLFELATTAWSRMRHRFPGRTASVVEGLCIGIVLAISIMFRGSGREFIYFQF